MIALSTSSSSQASLLRPGQKYSSSIVINSRERKGKVFCFFFAWVNLVRKDLHLRDPNGSFLREHIQHSF